MVVPRTLVEITVDDGLVEAILVTIITLVPSFGFEMTSGYPSSSSGPIVVTIDTGV